MVSVIYEIPAPYSFDRLVQVYGEGDMGWYEWRIVELGRVVHDSKDQGYGCAAIALRDGLIFASEGIASEAE